MTIVILSLTILFYLLASGLIARSLLRFETVSSTPPISYFFACSAVALHLYFTSDISFSEIGLNLSLSSMAVLVSALVTLMFVLIGLKLPVRRMGIIVYPIAIVCLIFSQIWLNTSMAAPVGSWSFSAHIVVALLAYSLLSIATMQSLLYWFQDRQIKARKQAKFLAVLPPLQTMDSLWFTLTVTGFVFLSLTLASGMFFSNEIFGVPFAFKHHTVLALLGWLVFAVIVIKRLSSGLRGYEALLWTVAGFSLIQLGYFGTKLVSESLALS